MTAGFRQTGERVIHRGHVVTMAVGTFEAPDGDRFERDLVRHPGAASVVPLLDARTVVLVRQYRAALDAELLEIPAGKLDVDGEDPADTARRELAEEVGYEATRVEHLATFHNSPGFTDEIHHVYLASDLTPCPHDRHGLEEAHLTVEEIDLDDVPDLVAAGHLRDAKTIIGLLLTRDRLRRSGS